MLIKMESSTTKPELERENLDVQKYTRSTGAFKDYLCGLDHLRDVVLNLESLMHTSLKDFYNCDDKYGNELNHNTYLRTINERLSHCNQALVSRGAEPLVIDSQAKFAVLINQLKELNALVHHNIISDIMDHWEKLKFVIETLQVLVDRFQKEVITKLKDIGCSYNETPGLVEDSLSKMYSTEIKVFLSELNETYVSTRLLASSSGNKVNKSLIKKTTLINKLMRNCDDETYPILLVVPALTVKLETMFRIARKWMDRDEKYIFDINEEIHQRKAATRNVENNLRLEREKHRQMLKSVRISYLQCQNSKRKLRELTDELNKLEQLVHDNEVDFQNKNNEKNRKVSMVNFLEISIAQTRRNYNLQLKKQRLLQQVKDLEKSIDELNSTIIQMKSEINQVASNQQEIEESAKQSEANFNVIKSELDSFSHKIADMAKELRTVRTSLNSLEVIQSCKTSPERVDEFYERQTTIKLAASLRNKIQLKKAKKGHV